MKELYLERREFELKVNPKKSTSGLFPLKHPELFINRNMRTHLFPKGFQSQTWDNVSIECCILLTNPIHDGIWLLVDDENDTIRIPGGFVIGDDGIWDMFARFDKPYHVIYRTLIERLAEGGPATFRDSWYLDPTMFPVMACDPKQPWTLADIQDILNYTITKFNLNIHDPAKPDELFYQYKLTGSDNETVTLQHIRIYLLKEVTLPIGPIVALTNYRNSNLIWYSRKDHYYNLREKTSRKGLFTSTYDVDIRTCDDGVCILDDIFRTEPVFGKLDIY